MQTQLQAALHLIAATPSYAPLAQTLAQLATDGKIRHDPNLPDRAVTHLSGDITLGNEALNSAPLSLAETLVHESHHRTQNPFAKTASYWAGIATGTNPMLRYERPAYQAAVDFLQAVVRASPADAAFAAQEIDEVRDAFAQNYGGTLHLVLPVA